MGFVFGIPILVPLMGFVFGILILVPLMGFDCGIPVLVPLVGFVCILGVFGDKNGRGWEKLKSVLGECLNIKPGKLCPSLVLV